MANGDRGNVGMTLLRIDRGVDTGPVFGYFRVTPDARESHVVTQHRVVLEHLDAIRDTLLRHRRRRGDADRDAWPPFGGMGSAVADRLREDAAPIARGKAGAAAVIALMYHDVVAPGCEETSGFPGRDANSYKVTVGRFRAHLDAILGTTSGEPAARFHLRRRRIGRMHCGRPARGPRPAWVLLRHG